MNLNKFINYFINKKGFTLLEILIVIGLAGFIMTAVFNVFNSGIISFFKVEDKADIQRNLRFLDNYISRNIRNAENIKIVNSFTGASLSSGEKIVGIENSILKYKEKGSVTKELVDLSEVSEIKFILNYHSKPDSIKIEINNKFFSEIVLNNYNYELPPLPSITIGKAIVFK